VDRVAGHRSIVPDAGAAAAAPWYGEDVRHALAGVLAVAVAASLAVAQEMPDGALERARRAAREHRYGQVLALLEPLRGRSDLAPGTAFAVAAELGRAYYHLGRYALAYGQLRRALELEPRSPEVGLYLEACAWLTGRREEALELFEALVASGARDLYLAVALPGERQFLADPRPWEIVARHARDLPVDLERGRALGVVLGMPAEEAARTVPGWPAAAGPEVAARAGPHVVWAFRLAEGRVAEIAIQVENALRYTPYRLRLACGLDWRATPEALERLLGPPRARAPGEAGSVRELWRFGRVEAGLEFGPPRQPAPPGIAPGSRLLRVIRLRRIAAP